MDVIEKLSPEEIRRQLGWGMLMPADLKMGSNRS